MIGSLSSRIVFKPGVGGGGRGITVLDDRSDSSIREAFIVPRTHLRTKG